MRLVGLLVLCLLSSPGAARAGEARCWIDHGAVVVAAAFGDIAGDFLLDASAARSQLHVTSAQSDGIDGASARRVLRLAGERAADFEMAVVDLDERTRALPTSIAGVIGVDLLKGYVVQIDFSPCRVRLARRAAPRPAGAIRLKLQDLAGAPVLRATLSDGRVSRAGLFAIDTADAVSTIPRAALSRTPLPGANPPTRLRALALAGQLFEQTPAAPGAQAAIGTAVWTNWRRLRLDIRHGWLELQGPDRAARLGGGAPG